MPSNEYYDSTGYPSTGAPFVSASLRAEFDAIEAGMMKFPVLAGNADLPIFVNSGGSALAPVSAASARTKLAVYSTSEVYAKDEVYTKAEVLAAVNAACPVGMIVAFSGGYCTDGSNGGFTNVLGNDAAAINARLNPSGWYALNGASLNMAGSIKYNGAGRYLHNITDSRFIMGSTAAGSVGGANTADHTHDISHNHTHNHTHTLNHVHSMDHYHNTQDYTLGTAQMPYHNHGLDIWVAPPNTGGKGVNGTAGNVQEYQSGYTGGGGAHNHGTTVWASSTNAGFANTGGNSADSGAASTATTSNNSAANTGNASVTENRPKFLTLWYIEKVI